MIRTAAWVLLLAFAGACSTSPEPEPRLQVPHAKTPVTYGRTVQALFALRLVKAHSDPLQSGQLTAAAHLISVWYDLTPFDEAAGQEEAYLRDFCRGAGWDTATTKACFERICRTVLAQLEEALVTFRALPTYRSGVDELLLDVEALKLELEFPPLAILALGEDRPVLARAQRRRLPPGLPVFVSAEHFRVFESAGVPWTQLDRIRDILERASALEEPAALSLFAGAREPTAQILFLLTTARAAGVRRVWVWGVHEGLAAAVAIELVPEVPVGEDVAQAEPASAQAEPASAPVVDLSPYATWGAALAAISRVAGPQDPVAVRVGALPRPASESSAPLVAAPIPALPSLDQIRDRMTAPEP